MSNEPKPYTYYDIHDAASFDDLDRLKRIMEQNPGLADSLDTDTYDNPLIFTAAKHGSLKVFEYLYSIARGSDPKPILNATNKVGTSVFAVSCNRNQDKIVQSMVAKGFDIASEDFSDIVSYPGEGGPTPDPKARASIVKLYLDNSGNPNQLLRRCVRYPAGATNASYIDMPPLLYVLALHNPPNNDFSKVIDVLINHPLTRLNDCARYSEGGREIPWNALLESKTKGFSAWSTRLSEKGASLPVNVVLNSIGESIGGFMGWVSSSLRSSAGNVWGLLGLNTTNPTSSADVAVSAESILRLIKELDYNQISRLDFQSSDEKKLIADFAKFFSQGSPEDLSDKILSDPETVLKLRLILQKIDENGVVLPPILETPLNGFVSSDVFTEYNKLMLGQYIRWCSNFAAEIPRLWKEHAITESAISNPAPEVPVYFKGQTYSYQELNDRRLYKQESIIPVPQIYLALEKMALERYEREGGHVHGPDCSHGAPGP